MSTTKKVSYREIGDWNVTTTATVNDDGTLSASTEIITMCMLATIRDELRRLNRVLQCPNFIAVPAKLDQTRHEGALSSAAGHATGVLAR